jgi:hypothetical protein
MSQSQFPGASLTLLHKDVLGLVDASGKAAGAAGIRMNALHQGPVGFPDRVLARPRLKPQDLVGLLLRHRARARRAALPRVEISLSVFTPSGRPAVEISL